MVVGIGGGIEQFITIAEVLAEREGDFDSGSRWALAWFDQFGFAEGEYGVAETRSKAPNTSVAGLAEAGILQHEAPGLSNTNKTLTNIE